METSPQIVIELTVNWSTFAITATLLLLFGILYNQFVTWLSDRQEGYTSLLVVAGVLMTLIGYAVVGGIGQALIAALLFAASGTPMVAGEVVRAIIRRNQLRGELERKTWRSELDSES